MMNVLKWIAILLKIVELIAAGLEKGDAVSAAASMFGVSEESIWKHGGF